MVCVVGTVTCLITGTSITLGNMFQHVSTFFCTTVDSFTRHSRHLPGKTRQTKAKGAHAAGFVLQVLAGAVAFGGSCYRNDDDDGDDDDVSGGELGAGGRAEREGECRVIKYDLRGKREPTKATPRAQLAEAKP